MESRQCPRRSEQIRGLLSCFWSLNKTFPYFPNSDRHCGMIIAEIMPRSSWVKSLNRVLLFVTPWTVAYQAPPSLGFSGQEYWSGLPFPSPFFLVHCIWRYNLSIRLIIGDVNFDHLVKVVYARCFSVKLAFFPFVIMFSNSWWDTWRLCKSPVPHQTSIVWC